jgi:hypothetical protein
VRWIYRVLRAVSAWIMRGYVVVCPARAAGSAPQGRSPAGAGPGTAARSAAVLMEIRANSAREPEIDGFCSSQRSRFVVAGSARRGRTPGDGWS